MKLTQLLVAGLIVSAGISTLVEAKNKPLPRGMIESMQAMPCGVKERGLAGLGSVLGSVGVTSVNSNEKLCPQYLLRTDDLEYHIRPMDGKHAVILPIGHEAEFKVKKDRLLLKVPDGDRKTRAYQVVSMEPLNTGTAAHESSYQPAAPRTDPPHAEVQAQHMANQNQSVPPPPPQ
jgi:hypothetical protein